MVAKFDLTDDSVVVIVGSGAGGGTLAHELGKKQVNCVVLEAGKHFTQADFENDEWNMFGKISWLDKRLSAGEWSHTKLNPHLPAWMVKGVGGTTIHWAGVSLRFQPHEFKARTTYGEKAGLNLMDWPIDYDELAPFYDQAEKRLGVGGTTASGLARLPENNHYKVIAAGARKIGYTQIGRPLAINSAEYDDRPQCQQIGFCLQGCVIGAKWSTLYTDVPRAIDTGYVELRSEATVLRIEHDKTGRPNAVVYVDAAGNQQRQSARVVCVAGNSIESPRLLLNSESSMYPDGLANSSGQVGRNYLCHSMAFGFAIHQKPVHMYRGNAAAAIISDEARNDPSRGFTGGYHIEGLSFGLPFVSAFMKPGEWGRDVASAVDKYDHMSSVAIVGEDEASESNAVTLHGTEKDQNGLPIPVVTKTFTDNDNALARHGFKQWTALSEAMGAERVIEMPITPAAHNMGTNRMSERPRDGVVNKWGQSHDIKNLFISDGSQFTSSGSPNPTLTIVALAVRQAGYIADSMRRGEI
ncbi:GMC family oxidoreductase [Rhizobium leguminosarum]|uniref:GMC family oxidoreductase n=1 Tax=Rhizobium leguminosarum TaxID=384 RepID=UPI003F9A982D